MSTLPNWVIEQPTLDHCCGWGFQLNNDLSVDHIESGGVTLAANVATAILASDGQSATFTCPNTACAKTVEFLNWTAS